MEIEVPIRKLVKDHHGGCVLYSLAIILNKDLREILDKAKLPKDYWVSEKDLSKLEELLPIEVVDAEIYNLPLLIEKIDEEIKNYNPLAVLYKYHSVVVYGMDKKRYFVYDSHKGRKKKIKKEVLGSVAEYIIVPKIS